MRLTVLIASFFLHLLPCPAQTALSGQVYGSSGKELPGASIVAYAGDGRILAYTAADKDGHFRLDVPPDAEHVTVTHLGYGPETVMVRDLTDPYRFTLREEPFSIREVAVTAESISESGDTLTYSVASFREAQDRSIADVISRMPGIEVRSDGAIEYQGKAISNFYIEGLDLMGGQYSLASSNIPAEKVKSVQVLENHQNVRSLKGVSFSEQAALNIVLKEDAKAVWSALADLGAGYACEGEGLVYDSRLMGMRFDRKFQTLMMYKNNNTGSDIGEEVQDISDLGGYQAEKGLIGMPEISGPAFEEERFSFNASHLLAANMLWKAGKDSDIRLQLSGFHDRERQRRSSSTEYLSIDGAPVVTEDYDLTSARDELKGELCYTHNSERTYVRSSTRVYADWNSGNGEMLYNSRRTDLMVRPYRRVLSEDLDISRTTARGDVWQLDCSTGDTYLPGQLLTIDGVTRHLDINMFSSRNGASFSRRIRRHYLKNTVGFDYRQQNIDGTAWRISQPYWEPSVQMSFGSHRLSGSLRTSYAHQIYGSKSSGQIWMEPSFTWEWEASPASQVSFSYRRSAYPYEGASVIDVPVYTSYRTVHVGTGNVGGRFSDMVTAGYSYRNPVSGIFFNLRPMYVRSSGNILYESTMESDTYVQRATGMTYDSDTYILGGRLAKSFLWCRTRLGLNGSWNSTGHAYLLDGAVQKAVVNAYTVSLDYSSRPLRWWTVEGKTSAAVSRRNSGGSITDWSHSLGFHFTPGSGWMFTIDNELYHSNGTGTGLNHFCDVALQYGRDRWEIALAANNIIGTSGYRQVSVSATMQSYTMTYLRPREVMLKFSVSF